MPDPCTVFPIEVTRDILLYLTLKERFTSQLVSKSWQSSLTDSSLWTSSIYLWNSKKTAPPEYGAFEKSLNYATDNSSEDVIIDDIKIRDAHSEAVLSFLSKKLPYQRVTRINQLYIRMRESKFEECYELLDDDSEVEEEEDYEYLPKILILQHPLYRLVPVSILTVDYEPVKTIVLGTLLRSQVDSVEVLRIITNGPIIGRHISHETFQTIPVLTNGSVPRRPNFTCWSLKRLNLTFGSIDSGVINCISCCPNLTHLVLRAKYDSEEYLIMINDLLNLVSDKLEALELSYLTVNSSALYGRSSWPKNLTTLSIHHVYMQHRYKLVYGSLEGLKNLAYRGNTLDLELFQQFKCGPNLETLYLGIFQRDDNHYQLPDPVSMPKLKKVSFERAITGMNFLSQCSKVVELDEVHLHNVEDLTNEALLAFCVELASNNVKEIHVDDCPLDASDIAKITKLGTKLFAGTETRRGKSQKRGVQKYELYE